MLRHTVVSVSAHRHSLLAGRARSMRLQMTASEAALWQCLSGKQLGVAFRRQVVIGGKFIADFAAPHEKVIVEVDGAYHGGRAAADERRGRKLMRLGWRVVCIPAEVVLRELPLAVEVIRAAIAAPGR